MWPLGRCIELRCSTCPVPPSFLPPPRLSLIVSIFSRSSLYLHCLYITQDPRSNLPHPRSSPILLPFSCGNWPRDLPLEFADQRPRSIVLTSINGKDSSDMSTITPPKAKTAHSSHGGWFFGRSRSSLSHSTRLLLVCPSAYMIPKPPVIIIGESDGT